jgi:hypothetical protein
LVRQLQSITQTITVDWSDNYSRLFRQLQWIAQTITVDCSDNYGRLFRQLPEQSTVIV